MASLILGAIGTAIGGPIGGAVGAILGGLIDTTVINWLFPVETPSGPKLEDVKWPTHDEGASANWIVGGSPRVAGTTLWVSDLIEETIEVDAGGGKGGGGGTIKKKIYFCHIAVAVAIDDLETPVASFGKVFADGKVLYNPTPNVSLAGSNLTVTVLGSGFKSRMKVLSPSGGPNLGKLVTNKNVIVAGFTNAVNNGTFKCLDSHKDTALGTSYAVFKNNACVAEGPSAATFLQVLPTHKKKNLRAITFYTGSASQNPDPLIESYKGAGNSPAYRGVAYVVFEKLALENYGNRPPLMQFIVTGTTSTVEGAIAKIMKRARRATNEYDVSAVSAPLGGYATTGPQSPASVLQPLLLAYNLLMQESTAGVLRFFPRVNATIVDVDPEQLVAHENAADEGSRLLEISDVPDSSLPNEVNVKYIDLERDDLTGSERERRRDNLTEGVLSVDMPLVLNSAKARGMARRFLWTPWANRQLFKLNVPTSEIALIENDIIRTKAHGDPLLLLIARHTRGFDEVLRIEAYRERRDVLVQLEEGNPPDNEVIDGGQDPVPESEIFDGPVLTPSGGSPADGPIIYGGGAVYGGSGGLIFLKSDDDEDWSVILDNPINAQIGTTDAVPLGGAGISPDVWDDKSSVTVTLVTGALASRTEDDVRNGANRAKIGGEYLAFMNAVLVGERTYTLSRFIRGLRNTEAKIATHAGGESFLLLVEGEVNGLHVNPSWIGTTKFFRCVPVGGDIDDFDSVTLTIKGQSLIPFSPATPTINVLDNGDVRFDWVRRTRVIVDEFGTTDPPLAEEKELYDAEIELPPGSGTLVKTWRALTIQSATLPFSERPPVPVGVPFTLRVWQLSIAMGRGTPLEKVMTL
jgi:hypothetical protein